MRGVYICWFSKRLAVGLFLAPNDQSNVSKQDGSMMLSYFVTNTLGVASVSVSATQHAHENGKKCPQKATCCALLQ